MLAEEANLVLASVPDARWVLLSLCHWPAFSLALVCAFLHFWTLPIPDFYPTLRRGPGRWPEADPPCGFLICVSKTFLSPNCLLFGLMVK